MRFDRAALPRDVRPHLRRLKALVDRCAERADDDWRRSGGRDDSGPVARIECELWQARFDDGRDLRQVRMAIHPRVGERLQLSLLNQRDQVSPGAEVGLNPSCQQIRPELRELPIRNSC